MTAQDEARSASFVGVTLDERYRILEVLGEGGMGTVYRAAQLGPDDAETGSSEVAVKVLHEELGQDASQRERFEREAQALFGLQHPHILAVHDYGVHEGLPYLVMELLEGQSLDELTEDGPLKPEVALEIFEQVLQGLAFAHAQGALHRDLKTENIFVLRMPAGQIHCKLLDFGLVKFMDDKRWGESKQLTNLGQVFGTPAYMSPEQCTGGPVDLRTDVYAMGVVLFELLTGAWPFLEETRIEMMRAHLSAAVPSIGETRPELWVHPSLETLLQKAMAKNKEHRFADAQGMLKALHDIPGPAVKLANPGGFVPVAPAEHAEAPHKGAMLLEPKVLYAVAAALLLAAAGVAALM